MIQNNDRPGHVEKFLTFCIAWFIGIYNDYYRIIIYKLHRLVSIDEHGRLIVRVVHISCHQRTDGCRRVIHYDMDRFAKCLTCTVDTDGSSKCIDICDLVSHDHNALLGAHKLLEGLRLDTRLDTGGLLHLLCLAAIVSDLVAILDHDLIAASSKCHLDRDTGIFIILKISSGIQSDTDT